MNTWIYELAIKPLDWYKKHYRNKLIMILIFCMGPLYYLLLKGLFGSYSGTPVILSCVIVLITFFLYVKYTTNISYKTPDFEKKYEESEKRLSDPNYVEFLHKSGYIDKIEKNMHL